MSLKLAFLPKWPAGAAVPLLSAPLLQAGLGQLQDLVSLGSCQTRSAALSASFLFIRSVRAAARCEGASGLLPSFRCRTDAPRRRCEPTPPRTDTSAPPPAGQGRDPLAPSVGWGGRCQPKSTRGQVVRGPRRWHFCTPLVLGPPPAARGSASPVEPQGWAAVGSRQGEGSAAVGPEPRPSPGGPDHCLGTRERPRRRARRRFSASESARGSPSEPSWTPGTGRSADCGRGPPGH